MAHRAFLDALATTRRTSLAFEPQVFAFEAQNQQDPTLAIPPNWAGH
jgi:hypothetical protein